MHSYWVKTLNVKYTNKHAKKSKTVEDTTQDQKDEDIHSKLNLTVRYALKTHGQAAGAVGTIRPFEGNYEQYGEIDLKYNVLVANIGFIISKTPINKDHLHGREFITFPITVPNCLIFNLLKLKDTGEKFADDMINRHVYLHGKKQSILANPGTYAHSEELLVSYLESEEFIRKIPELLKSQNKNPKENYKIYAVILDIHSYRYPCFSCQGLQCKNPQNCRI